MGNRQPLKLDLARLRRTDPDSDRDHGLLYGVSQFHAVGQVQLIADLTELRDHFQRFGERFRPHPYWAGRERSSPASAPIYHLLEIGGFTFADLNATNKADVVAAVSAVAKSIWEK